MSANKTTHYNLHVWAPEDDFLRTEFNENFAKLDGAVRMVFGTYGGSSPDWGAAQEITLGFRPTAVLILTDEGLKINGNSYSYGGMAGIGKPVGATALVLDDTGFTVSNVYSKYYLNRANVVYYYIAFY